MEWLRKILRINVENNHYETNNETTIIFVNNTQSAVKRHAKRAGILAILVLLIGSIHYFVPPTPVDPWKELKDAEHAVVDHSLPQDWAKIVDRWADDDVDKLSAWVRSHKRVNARLRIPELPFHERNQAQRDV